MLIFLKYVLKNMLEKKGRLILLLLAVSLSTGLFIASQEAMKTALTANEKTQYEAYEGKTIRIASKDGVSPLDYSSIDQQGMKNFTSELLLQNLKENAATRVALHGRDNLRNAEYKVVKGSLKDVHSNQVIISQRISKERKLKINSKIKLKINEQEQTFKVAAIVTDKGIFYNDLKNNYTLLMDYQALQERSGQSYNQALAVAKGKNVEKAIQAFNKNNEDYLATNLYDQGAMEQVTQQVEAIFTLMFVFVALISVLIIYQAFKLLVTERLNVIGTFLSQGATFRQIILIFLLESLLYSFVGGGIGVGLGYGIMVVITRITSPLAAYGVYEKTQALPLNVIGAAMLFAVGLGIISALLPTLKIRSLPVKAIILSEPIAEKNMSWSKAVFGLILLLFSMAAIFFSLPNQAILLAVFSGFVGCILIYPKLINVTGDFIFRFLRGKVSAFALAIKNISTSKVLQGNITLLFISLSILLLISSLSESMSSLINSMYRELNYGISIQTDFDGTKVPEEEVNELVLQQDFMETKEHSNHTSIQTTGSIKNTTIMVTAVNELAGARQFYRYLNWENKHLDKTFERMASERTFMASKSMAEQLKLKQGDKVKLTIGSETAEFTLAGTYDNKAMNSFALIKEADLPENQRETYSHVHYYQVKGKQAAAKKKLKKLLKDYPITITTRNQTMQENLAQNNMMLNMVTVFAVMTAVIGSLGMVSNVTIAFLQRKRSFAIYDSVGMRPAQRMRVFLHESLTIATLAFVLTVVAAYMEANLLGTLLSEIIRAKFQIHIDLISLPLIYLLSIVIMLFSSLPAVLTSRKLNIVEELKRE